ncbi:protein roadkill-like [Calliphora vicina]|uniref:protein roadkill-like n=1 Tax=Calliphora vicina TaxID=7373 RepID=UPI00325A9636
MQLDLTNTEKVKNIEFIKHEDLYAKKHILLPYDNLTILCEIKYTICTNKWTPTNQTFERIETKLNNDLVSLFESEKHWDVTLVADGHELHAHKCILASRSDVFAAMFEHEMEESKSNRVVVTDCDHKVLKEMLRYIYTGKAPNLDEMAAELLAVCNKYGLENLKYMCEEKLCNRLTIDTVAETLILADLYRAKELKEHTIHFMNTHANAVTKTEGWKKLVNNHFHLITEVYLKLVE